MPVDLSEHVDQRNVAIEVHRVLVRRPGLSAYSESATAQSEVAGLSRFQGILQGDDALRLRCRVQD